MSYSTWCILNKNKNLIMFPSCVLGDIEIVATLAILISKVIGKQLIKSLRGFCEHERSREVCSING